MAKHPKQPRCVCCKARRRANDHARMVRKSLLMYPELWKERAPEVLGADSCTLIESDEWHVSIVPCWLLPCCRFFDCVRLRRMNGSDIAFGPLVGLRLRAAARYFVAHSKPPRP